ncbi:unnamed protein product [Pocillopora meandrina]|uniref:Uncharacterized protein n=1 Tax=Pocillopora meandrina TaxID=46732 RepID=A0AAU9WD17_9CNID|nr:unnamed protein product [Pocillopora meandrina]
MAPLVMPPAKKATGPIVNRALSDLSSLRVNKLFGNGIQTDGCLIPHNRLGVNDPTNPLYQSGEGIIDKILEQASPAKRLSESC